LARHIIKKNMGKKGFFMTFIAIALVVTFTVIFAPKNPSLVIKDSSQTRINLLNEHVKDLENVYLERILQSSSTSAIKSLILYMETENTFLQNFDTAFTEVLLTGKIGGIPIDSIIGQNMMEGNNYNDWLDKINITAKSLYNIDSTFSMETMKVYQTDPWEMIVDANVSFSITSETASWKNTINIITKIDIGKFNDPYYSINTGGLYNNKINRSFVKLTEWNLETIAEHIKHGTYIHVPQSKAPSFIMRFTNTSTNSSCCGIQSIVDPNKLPISLNKINSYTDYQFFNNTYQINCDKVFNITSLWPDYEPVKLDFNHMAMYNLTGFPSAQNCV